MSYSPKCRCEHTWDEHSQILAAEPCLDFDCDCPGFVELRWPNPVALSGWHCPICGGTTEDYGTERRRIGRRPWKRTVHTECLAS